MEKSRESFSGRFAIVMALAGSAIGLGNIWRFPFLVGEGGGAAFIIVYILCSLLICVPIMLAEATLGRSTHRGTFGALEALAPGSKWKWLGLLTVLSSLLLVSYYSVVGGWSIEFLFKGLGFSFTRNTPEAAAGFFPDFIGKPIAPLLFQTTFIGLTCLIVLGGIQKGIEKFSNVSIPVLFVLIVIVAVYSISLPGAKAGVRYLVRPDFSALSASDVFAAMGQAFFSLSLGVGAILTYSSYVRKEENLMATSLITSVCDLMFALLAGFAVMPAVFAAGIAPESGPGLIFQAVPFVFAKMGTAVGWISDIAAILFFLAVLVAALSSSISMVEVGVTYLMEQAGMSRRTSVLVIFLGTWAVGCVCSLSFGPLAGWNVLGDNFFGFCDRLVSNYMLPFGGLLFSLFVGWKMDKASMRRELTNDGSLRIPSRIYGTVRFLIKWVAPVGIVAVFVTNLLL